MSCFVKLQQQHSVCSRNGDACSYALCPRGRGRDHWLHHSNHVGHDNCHVATAMILQAKRSVCEGRRLPAW